MQASGSLEPRAQSAADPQQGILGDYADEPENQQVDKDDVHVQDSRLHADLIPQACIADDHLCGDQKIIAGPIWARMQSMTFGKICFHITSKITSDSEAPSV